MQTTIEQQIEAVRNARRIINIIATLDFDIEMFCDKANLDLSLNDAANTLQCVAIESKLDEE